MAAPKRMKMTTNHSSARTLTSLFSWRVSGFTMSGIGLQRPLANRFLHPRLVNGNDGLSFQLFDKRPHPDAADTDQRAEVPNGVMKMRAAPGGLDDPIDGHVTGDEENYRDHADGLGTILD